MQVFYEAEIASAAIETANRCAGYGQSPDRKQQALSRSAKLRGYRSMKSSDYDRLARAFPAHDESTVCEFVEALGFYDQIAAWSEALSRLE